jgi:outer membrane protein with beta-barrel domain
MRSAVLAVVAVAVMTASSAAAQEMTYGVKGGVNFANLRFDDAEDTSFDDRIGLAAGGYVTIPLAGRLSVQPEVLFSQKGAKFDELGARGRLELDYLDVPVLMRYSFGRWRGFHVFGGPSIGLKLKARAVAEFAGEEDETDIGDDVETIDFGVAAGAGIEIGRFTIDGRYVLGLSNVNAVEAEQAKIRTRVYAGMVGFRF